MRPRFVDRQDRRCHRHARVRARVQLLPVPGRQRRPGREHVPRSQPVAVADRQSLREQFNLDGSKLEQFGAYVRETAQGNLGVSLLSRRPVTTEIREAIWPTVLLVGTATLAGDGDRHPARDPRRVAAPERVRRRVDDVLDVHVLGARLLARHAAARRVRRSGSDLFPTGGLEDPGSDGHRALAS